MDQTDKDILLNQQLCFEIYQAHKTFNKFYLQVLKEWGLTYAQYIVMLTLYQYGTLSVKELGDKVSLDSGTLTPMLRRLEKENWVVKSRSIVDERRLDVSPSEYAIKQKPALFKRVSGCLNMINLNDDEYAKYMLEVNELTADIKKVNDSMSER